MGEGWLSAPLAKHGITPKCFYPKLQFFKGFPFLVSNLSLYKNPITYLTAKVGKLKSWIIGPN